MHECAISPPPWLARQLDFYLSISSDEVLGMHEIIDSTRVMRNGIVKILLLLICFLEEPKQTVELVGELSLHEFEFVENLISDEDSVSDFKWHHSDPFAAIEHNVRCLRIN